MDRELLEIAKHLRIRGRQINPRTIYNWYKKLRSRRIVKGKKKFSKERLRTVIMVSGKEAKILIERFTLVHGDDQIKLP